MHQAHTHTHTNKHTVMKISSGPDDIEHITSGHASTTVPPKQVGQYQLTLIDRRGEL